MRCVWLCTHYDDGAEDFDAVNDFSQGAANTQAVMLEMVAVVAVTLRLSVRAHVAMEMLVLIASLRLLSLMMAKETMAMIAAAATTAAMMLLRMQTATAPKMAATR